MEAMGGAGCSDWKLHSCIISPLISSTNIIIDHDSIIIITIITIAALFMQIKILVPEANLRRI